MRTIGIVVGLVIVAGLVALAFAAWMLPNEGSFRNEVDIAAPPEKVWQVINDKERYTEWQTQITRVEVINDGSWIEYPANAPEPLRFTLVKDERPTRMSFEYTMGASIHGSWVGEAEATATGTRLRTVDGYRADGVLMRLLMASFFDLDAFAKDWNSKLKQRVETLDR